jgi:hypothetical protein
MTAVAAERVSDYPTDNGVRRRARSIFAHRLAVRHPQSPDPSRLADFCGSPSPDEHRAVSPPKSGNPERGTRLGGFFLHYAHTSLWSSTVQGGGKRRAFTSSGIQPLRSASAKRSDMQISGKSFSPYAALAISLETCRHVALWR